MSRTDVVWCLALSMGLAVALLAGLALVGYEHEPSVPPQTAVSTYVGPGDGRWRGTSLLSCGLRRTAW